MGYGYPPRGMMSGRYPADYGWAMHPGRVGTCKHWSPAAAQLLRRDLLCASMPAVTALLHHVYTTSAAAARSQVTLLLPVLYYLLPT
jgi:hypothetical protein